MSVTLVRIVNSIAFKLDIMLRNRQPFIVTNFNIMFFRQQYSRPCKIYPYYIKHKI